MPDPAAHAHAIPLAIVLGVAASASIALNIGKAVQKMKVEVLKKGRKVLQPEYRRDFLIWCVGISLTVVAGLLTFVAQLMSDKTSLVSSLNGVGLIGLAIFSMLVLKERVGLREWGAVAMIGIGTAVISYFNVKNPNEHYYFNAMLWCVGVTTAICVLMIIGTKVFNKGRALVYAATAGLFLGIMNIFYHVGGVVSGGAGFWANYSWVYFLISFLILGNVGFLFTNLAFFHGTGILVVPTVNSFLIMSPLVYEVLIFNTVLMPMQYAGVAIILAGVIILTTGIGGGGPKHEQLKT